MEIGSVSSSVNSASTYASSAQQQLRTRQQEQDKQTQQTQQAQSAQQTQQASQLQQMQVTPPVDESESAANARAESERNRPTVNTSGQTVGTRINTTA